MADKRYDTITGDVVKTTDKAILLYHGDDQETWIPRSVIEDGESAGEEDDLDLNVETWFVEKEGL